MKTIGLASLQHRFQSPRLWWQGLIVASSVLILSTTASAAKAATFTVEFTGTVNSLVKIATPRFGGPVETNETALTTRNTSRLVQLADRITGNYIFDDVTREILSSRFRFVSAGSGVSLDPSEADPSDIVFVPINNLFVGSSSQADSTSAQYFQRFAGPMTTSEKGNAFSLVAAQTFSYQEGGSELGASVNIQTRFFGTIDQLNVVEPDPTAVPEPTTALGVLLVSGLGLALSRRQSARATVSMMK